VLRREPRAGTEIAARRRRLHWAAIGKHGVAVTALFFGASAGEERASKCQGGVGVHCKAVLRCRASSCGGTQADGLLSFPATGIIPS